MVEKIKKDYKFVDMVFGTHNLYQFPELLYQALAQRQTVIEVWEGTERIVDNGRGAYISKSLEAVEIAKKKKVFDRELEVEVPLEIYDELKRIIGESIGEQK